MADTQKLVLIGGVGIAAYMFRSQISSWLGLTAAPAVNPVAAAQSAAATAAASGATPVQQAVVAQQAATAAAAQQAVQIPQGPPPVSAGTDIGVDRTGPNTLLAKAAGGDMATALSLAGDPRAQLNLYQWNWYRVQWNAGANTLNAAAHGLDANAPVNAQTYLGYLAL
jgi:hypothetical protein